MLNFSFTCLHFYTLKIFSIVVVYSNFSEFSCPSTLWQIRHQHKCCFLQKKKKNPIVIMSQISWKKDVVAWIFVFNWVSFNHKERRVVIPSWQDRRVNLLSMLGKSKYLMISLTMVTLNICHSFIQNVDFPL